MMKYIITNRPNKIKNICDNSFSILTSWDCLEKIKENPSDIKKIFIFLKVHQFRNFTSDGLYSYVNVLEDFINLKCEKYLYIEGRIGSNYIEYIPLQIRNELNGFFYKFDNCFLHCGITYKSFVKNGISPHIIEKCNSKNHLNNKKNEKLKKKKLDEK